MTAANGMFSGTEEISHLACVCVGRRGFEEMGAARRGNEFPDGRLVSPMYHLRSAKTFRFKGLFQVLLVFFGAERWQMLNDVGW